MDFIDHRSTANFIFSLSATDEKLRIKSDGNVGIGVSNPSTKLEVDGVITTAGLTTTADINFGDNDKAIFGAGSDLQIYHDGSNSFIDDQGTGSLVLQSNGAFTVIQNSSGVANARFDSAGAASLRYNGSEKLATTSTGIGITGNATFDDNGKAVFGAGSDLQIYHDGANSYIAEGGTGNLQIQGQNLSLEDSTGTRFFLGIQGGETRLYNQGNEKVAVTSTGIDVTGTVTADGLTVDGSSAGRVTSAEFKNNLNAGGTEVAINLANQGGTSNADVNLVANRVGANFGSDFYIETSDGTDGTNRKRFNIGENGDISFYEDTGTTAKLFWDASAESLGIGTSSPAGKATVKVGDDDGNVTTWNSNYFLVSSGDSTISQALGIGVNTANDYAFLSSLQPGTAWKTLKYKALDHIFDGANDTERMRIDSSGDMIMKGGRIKVRENDDGNDAVVITRDADEGYVNLYSSGSQTVEIRGNGNSYFNGGNVGIGTSSPSSDLHISSSTGSAKLTSSAGGANLFMESADNNTTRLRWASNSSFAIRNDTTSSDVFNIDQSGNVGVGTSNPEKLLHLKTSAINTAFARIESTATNSYPTLSLKNDAREYQLTAHGPLGDVFTIYDGTAGSHRLVIDSSGQVGIGTSSPRSLINASSATGAILTLESSDTTLGENQVVGQIDFYANDASTNSTGNKAFIKAYSETAGGNKVGLDFATSSSTSATGVVAMTINSDGNVGIGTSSPSSSLTTETDSGVLVTDASGLRQIEIVPPQTSNSFVGEMGTRSSHPLVFNTVNTERMRIDSSGNLLVGKTALTLNTEGHAITPTYARFTRDSANPVQFNRTTNDGEIATFHKDGTTVGSIGSRAGTVLYITSTGTNETGLDFGGTSINPMLSGSLSNGTTDLGNAGNRFKDLYLSGTAYTNALGVGTASPDVKVDIVDTAADVQLRVYKFDGTNNTRLSFTADDSGAKIHYRDATNGGALRFNNNAGEMARFDASGNLLVGKTGTGIGTVGVEAKADGQLWATRDGNPVLSLNRETSDGSIAVFYKDGTSVGSIGAESSGLLIGSGNVGVRFIDSGQDRIIPRKTTLANADAAIDLGDSGSRFKDLYLSGGVYLGGTGSANHLDDYEEGTFSPTLYGASSAGTTTYATVTGTYTKVGNRCTVNFVCSVTATTGTGSLRLGGLPFTSSGENTTAIMINNLNWGGGTYLMAYVGDNSDFARVYYVGDDNTWQQQQITNEAQHFIFTLSYQTA